MKEKLDKSKIENIAALTPLQEGILFHYLKDPGSDQYFEQLSLAINGDIDITHFRNAWDLVVQSNEMLRTVFRWEELDKPVQVVLKKHELEINMYGFSGKPPKNQKELKREMRLKDRRKKFDLTNVPFRALLCKIQPGKYEMILSNHHIICDGWSNGIILKEFLEYYNDLTNGCQPIKPAKSKFIEFVKWGQSQDAQKQKKFWKDYLVEFSAKTELPIKERKAIGTHAKESKSYPVKTGIPLKNKLEFYSKHCKVTLSSLLYAAWGLLLQRYINDNDVLFGTTVSGRTAKIKGLDEMVGLFINTLPLRFKTSPEESISRVVKKISGVLQEREEFGYISLTTIYDYAELENKSEPFDSLVVIDNYPLDTLSWQRSGSLSIDDYSIFEMSHYDLTISIMQSDDIEIRFIYGKDILEKEAVINLSNHYLRVLESIVDNPDAKAVEVNILTEEEKRLLLIDYNTTDRDYPKERTVSELFRDQAAAVPDSTAVGCNDEMVSYKELDRKSNRLVGVLTREGVKTSDMVGLMIERSIDLIVGIIAVLKVNAVCLPIDVMYPDKRKSEILKNSGAGFLLKQEHANYQLDAGVKSKAIDLEYPGIDPGSGSSTPAKFKTSNDGAFVFHTSGSTGRPKGIIITHAGTINNIYSKIKEMDLNRKDIFCQCLNISFAASVWQIFAPLILGSVFYIYPRDVIIDSYELFRRVEANCVTIIEVVPSMLNSYLQLCETKGKLALHPLRTLLLTGEKVETSLVNRFFKNYNICLLNAYGQTEYTDDATYYEIPYNPDTEMVPIGKPALNTRLYILDRYNCLQPVGIPGELFVAGDSLAKGYLNAPEATGEKFTDNPFEPKKKMYKTGDLTRWLWDGNIRFLGRQDHQVKIRGFRIELGEIENHVLRSPGVKQAAVVVRENRQAEKSLWAFVVPGLNRENAITASYMRGYLSKTLPDYMLPAHFVVLEKLPETSSGKIDRQTLVKMQIRGSAASGTPYIPPNNEREAKIRETWMELLDMDKEQISIDDNFFDLGGHSLLLIKLKNKLEKTFNLKREIGIIDLFSYPTIVDQSRLIRENLKGVEKNKPGKRFKLKKNLSPVKKESRDIAVIGISLSVPGANNIDELWKNLIGGTESISFFKEEELEYSKATSLIQDDAKLIPAGGILGDVDLFDAYFFGINPGEAEIMDPQQRLFLEYAWRALEDAGYVGATYPGPIGVYAGSGWNIYLLNNILSNTGIIKSRGEFHTMIANDKDFLATRVSYKLNLKGPALTVQTACSSSLTAVHLAKQGLLNSECDMALAGGVSVRVPERTGYVYTEGIHLSPDGHCRPFDAEARGTVFGNGIGIVVLKRLVEAVKDNDHIYAVIKGSAINNDGSLKIGYTSPGEIGQSEVILKALQESGVQPNTIGYIETHGTGTVLGDPVEITALTRAFSTFYSNTSMPGTDKEKEKKQYCAVGSVKANVGHLDVAAGVVGFIKAALCLKYKQIPPAINCEHPNPLIDFENSPFYVNRTLKNWTASSSETGSPRRASVSALGIGGTNAHVILEEWPEGSRPVDQCVGGCKERRVTQPRKDHLILLSARTETALDKMTGDVVKYLQGHPAVNLADAAYTLQVGRKAFNHRRMLVCPDVNEAVKNLPGRDPGKVQTYLADESDPQVIFMFSGQGAQYINMGLELYQTGSFFREQMDRCFEILKPLMDYDIKAILYPGECKAQSAVRHAIDQTEIAQPLLFAFEYALAKLLIKWGIKPYAMIGHSIGEYVAACLAGIFSLEDALNLVAARGQLMQETSAGSMLGIPLPEKELTPLLNNEISLAAVNSPSDCVVSGPFAALEALERQLLEKGIKVNRLHTSHAFHSTMMGPILKEFEERVKPIRLNKPQIPYISNLSGNWITVEDTADPQYWTKHIRQTVRFADGIKLLLNENEKNTVFIEVGPGRTLSALVKKCMGDHQKQMAVNLVRHPHEKVSDPYFLVNKIGWLWIRGVKIDWQGYHAGEKRCRIPLPTYPFEGRPYWIKDHMCKQPLADLQEEREPPASLPVKNKDISKWFYVPSWKRSDLKSARPGTLKEASTLLVFVDNCGFGLKLINQLGQGKQNVITVRPGSVFTKEDNRSYTINPGEPGDYETLIPELLVSGRLPGKIVHLWNIGEKSVGETGLEDFRKAQELGFFSLLYLTRAIGKHDFDNKFHITVLTDTMFAVMGEEPVYPGKTTLLGPIKVIPQEYPNIRCRSIDINLPKPGSWQEKKMIDWLLAELLSETKESVVAYRGNSRLVQTVEQVQLDKNKKRNVKLKRGGVYLITGGTGNIGLTMAEFLAKTRQAKLILTGRSFFPAPGEWENWLNTHGPGDEISIKIRKLKKIGDLGSETIIARADVTHLQEMETVFIEAEKKFGKLDGVIHAAGTAGQESMKSIKEINTGKCYQVFHPKVSGLFVLEKILKGKEIDFCLLFSSLSSILGGIGLAAYSAANIFMDAFARGQNYLTPVHWISINWDLWEFEEQKNKTGGPGANLLALAMEPGEGIEALKYILSQDEVHQVIVSTGELSTRGKQWIDGESPGDHHHIKKQESKINVNSRPGLRNAYAAPANNLERMITDLWEDYFGIKGIGIHDNFFDLGATSLDLIRLNDKLKKTFKKELAIEKLFTYPTIHSLAGFLDQMETNKSDREMDDNEMERTQTIVKGKKRLKRRKMSVME